MLFIVLRVPLSDYTCKAGVSKGNEFKNKNIYPVAAQKMASFIWSQQSLKMHHADDHTSIFWKLITDRQVGRNCDAPFVSNAPYFKSSNDEKKRIWL